MLITASTNPKGKRIDGTSDSSDVDGVINATGDHTSWVLYDSISYMDDDDVDSGENGEFGYGQIVFAQDVTKYSTKHFTTTSANVVDFPTTSDANYILRQGTNIGYTVADWVVSSNGSSSSVPNWIFTSTMDKVSSDEYAGWEGIKDVYGQLNPIASTLSTIEVFSSKFNVYTNPVNEFVFISSALEINKIEIYNLLGKRVISVSKLNDNRLDISNLAKGVYMMKLTSGEFVASKKLIKN